MHDRDERQQPDEVEGQEECELMLALREESIQQFQWSSLDARQYRSDLLDLRGLRSLDP